MTTIMSTSTTRKELSHDRIVEDSTALQYPFTTGKQLLALCAEHKLSISQLMLANEAAWRPEAEVLADALGLTRRLRWIGGSEIGYERETEASGERLRGLAQVLDDAGVPFVRVSGHGDERLAAARAAIGALHD